MTLAGVVCLDATRRKALWLGILFLALAGVIPAAGVPLVLVGTSDAASVTSLSIDSQTPGSALAVAWYLPRHYSSVSVGLNFMDQFGAGVFNAYLMNGIGPLVDQTFFSNQIAATTFAASPELAWLPLWTNLVLTPGTYYLVVGTADPGSFGGWGATTAPVVTLAPGVTQGDPSGIQFFAAGADVNLTYLPASNFAVDVDLYSGQLMYDVAIPEPASMLLLAVGGILLLGVGRRRLGCRA